MPTKKKTTKKPVSRKATKVKKKLRNTKGSLRQKLAIAKVVESRGKKAVSKAMIEAGYSPATAKNPSNLTNSKTWDEMLEEVLTDEIVLDRHAELLNSHRLDHMVFPPESSKDDDEEDIDESEDSEELEDQPHGGALKRRFAGRETASLTDEEIKVMLAEVNCQVRKIVHGEMARHVYFWSPDNKARKDAIDLAYKVKNKYPANRGPGVVVPIQVNVGEDRSKYG